MGLATHPKVGTLTLADNVVLTGTQAGQLSKVLGLDAPSLQSGVLTTELLNVKNLVKVFSSKDSFSGHLD